ncbi:TPA: beta family protein [Vibrio vulnificus]|nr:beta family protein [Vibrio vulnificus]HAS6325332.1 beta family protein [Vibrio vulnificus]HDY7537417.1 beta family protein [Vibrio vulnificus]HDY7551598.1 beta family protein [Vibrio vulnificus]
MSEYKYYPLIKTRDAELRCFRQLKEDDFLHILPIYELTKSRSVKSTAPDGDIHKRMSQISEIQGVNPFILDLCTSPKYENPQIRQLLQPYDGFSEWRAFLNFYKKDLNIIPMIHIYEDEESSFDDVVNFVTEMKNGYEKLAVRLPYNLEADEYSYYLEPIVSHIGNSKLIVLLDADYIRNESKNDIEAVIEQFSCSVASVLTLPSIDACVMLCTTFPASVAKEGKSDSDGEFRIYEEQIYQGVKERVPVKYGDYASINTEQIEIKGGTFVPRIDIALKDSFIYKRYRRDDGSYPRCAKEMIRDEKYIDLGIWSNEEITLASKNLPSGISPSFWISVRMFYYMRTRVNLRTNN